MKKWITLMIAASFVVGAFATMAHAEEVSIEERMNTEGKILATMNLHKEDMISQMETMYDEVLTAQDAIGLETNVSGDSKGRLSAIGQLEGLLENTIQEARRTSAENYNKLSDLFQRAEKIHRTVLGIRLESSLLNK